MAGRKRKPGPRDASGRLKKQRKRRTCAGCGQPSQGRLCLACHNQVRAAKPILCACGKTRVFGATKCRCCYERAVAEGTHRICEVCGKGFRKKKSGNNAGRCCSRECGFEWMRIDGARRRVATEERRGREHRRALLRKCPICRWSFEAARPAQRCCSAKCERKRASRASAGACALLVESRTEHCEECAKSFHPWVPTGSRRHVSRWCSPECKRRHQQRLHAATEERAGRVLGTHVQRAIKHGVPYELGITTRRVCERDGWRCHICGEPTLRRMLGDRKSKRLPNLPVMDHVIPFPKGGGHLWSNVRCACWRCNIAKGDRVESPSETLRRAAESEAARVIQRPLELAACV